MTMNGPVCGALSLCVSLLYLITYAPETASAHCDTLDGPVVQDARTALEQGNLTPVLKWVTTEHEEELRSVFNRSIAVRSKGREAKELADMYFFETLVRLHRTGEGAPYTGLKPAGSPLESGVAAADTALAAGNVDGLTKAATDATSRGIVERFKRAFQAKAHAGESVSRGRAFVRSYVEFIHYVEGVFAAIESQRHTTKGATDDATADHAEHHG